jgi:hypothetical protein
MRERMILPPAFSSAAKSLSFLITNFPSVHVSLDGSFVNSNKSVKKCGTISYVYSSRYFVAFRFDLRLSCMLTQGKRIAPFHADKKQSCLCLLTTHRDRRQTIADDGYSTRLWSYHRKRCQPLAGLEELCSYTRHTADSLASIETIIVIIIIIIITIIIIIITGLL